MHVTSAAVDAGVALSRTPGRAAPGGSAGDGARVLEGNPLVGAVASKAASAEAAASSDEGRRSRLTFRVDVDPAGTHAVFSWCRAVEEGGVVELVCEEESRAALSSYAAEEEEE